MKSLLEWNFPIDDWSVVTVHQTFPRNLIILCVRILKISMSLFLKKVSSFHNIFN